VLPHGYPFRLGERRNADGAVVLLVSGNAALLRGGAALPEMLLVEMMAQAALVALPADGQQHGGATRTAPRGVLAGVEDVHLAAAVRAGDRLEARATLLGRLGGAVKARVELRRDGEPVAVGDLLLSLA
jgi:3-hydroxymyristoyl/3-hydroxydecanoyl-(acyl carrier protein) dehydratase